MNKMIKSLILSNYQSPKFKHAWEYQNINKRTADEYYKLILNLKRTVFRT